MSSILDALEKLESRRTQGGGPEPPHRTRRSITPLLAGAALMAFAAGIAIAALWLRPKPSMPAPAAVAQVAPPATTPPAASPPASPPATQPPPPPAPEPVAAARPSEQPWAEVVAPTPVRDTAPPPPATAATARTPAHGRSPDTAEPAAVVAAVAPPTAAPVPPPPAAAPSSHAAERPAGAPTVRVSFLVYSSAPDRRTVALAIDQGGLVTLHEGESSNGVSVAQILPDGVELTWQGQSFKVPARD